MDRKWIRGFLGGFALASLLAVAVYRMAIQVPSPIIDVAAKRV